MKVWPVIELALIADGACVMITVVRAEGSSPREAGARIILTRQGFHGTIGGGALEWKALATAQAMLGKPRATRLITQSLGPDLGQCCGGRVTLAIEAFDSNDLLTVEDFAARESEGPFTVTGRFPNLNVSEDFGERRRSVLIFGAGHVGRAVVLALAPLPYDVIWADPRAEAFPSAIPSNATIAVGDPLAVIAGAPVGAFAFIMSHSHPLDLGIADAALRNPKLVKVGVIGSATKRARFEKRLREAGVDEQRLKEMICPIGHGGIGSKLAAAIAVSVVAQILVLDEALAAKAQVPTPAGQMTAG